MEENGMMIPEDWIEIALITMRMITNKRINWGAYVCERAKEGTENINRKD